MFFSSSPKPGRSFLSRISPFADRQSLRIIKDIAVRYAMSIGGISVIAAILLIFIYLVYEVIPLFESAKLEQIVSYEVPQSSDGKTLAYSVDEYTDIAVRYTSHGDAIFFRTADGELVDNVSIPIPANVQITAFAKGQPQSGVVAFGLSDGTAILTKHLFLVSYPNDIRSITPKLEFLLDSKPVVLFPNSLPVKKLAVQSDADSTTVVGWTPGQDLSLQRFERKESFLDDSVLLEQAESRIPINLDSVEYLLLDKEQRILYAADAEGVLIQYDIKDLNDAEIRQRLPVVEKGHRLTSLEFLTGDLSLLVGESDGTISQWFSVRGEDNREELSKIRVFDELKHVTAIVGEYSRKGFLAADETGDVGIFHTTAHQTLTVDPVAAFGINFLAIAPRGDAFLAESLDGYVHFWDIENQHPEISWSALWQEVWYESYSKPDFVWQSSAADNDFEPKFSLTPLAFGTLKAAFYAMLVAIPIAIFGAIYTAYFMAPGLRRVVKPAIEIMEALPTVILGFLAGLWLAPALETHLPGTFSLLLILPLGLLCFAYSWQLLPIAVRNYVPDGWQPLLLIPVVFLLGWLSFAISAPIEELFFSGDMRRWLTHDLGGAFDQRNSIVVGIAMGFAVIPTIFSIAEDAVFSVPKHLTFGSLALGATPWQTMARVVILTASPGIFSAVMIGLGRAVGETMIVLMATGNTPVMDFSIFEGMRTLAANIAVEMPESEVSSTHYRVLFLAALVLFAFTFLVNTFAELVRHRLRQRYSSL